MLLKFFAVVNPPRSQRTFMTKDQETPVTETQNSGEPSPKPSKPKTRASARGKTATAPETAAKTAEKTAPPSPASKTSPKASPSSASADSAPKSARPKTARNTTGKSASGKKSTGTADAPKTGTPDNAPAKSGTAPAVKAASEKTARPAAPTAQTPAEKSVEKAPAASAAVAPSTASGDKKPAAKSRTARGRQTTARIGKDGVTAAKAEGKAVPAAATAEDVSANEKSTARSRGAKTGSARGTARSHAGKSTDAKPDAATSAAGKPAGAAPGTVATSEARSEARTEAKPDAKPASAAGARPSARARAAAPRTKTSAQSPAPKAAAQPEKKNLPSSTAAPQDRPAPARTEAGQRQPQTAHTGKPAAEVKDATVSVTATVTSTEVLALASGEKLAIASRESLAITASETLALEAVTDTQDTEGRSEGSDDAPRRKNRRGRRGGRGRNRRKDQNGDNGEMQASDGLAADEVFDDAPQNGQSQALAEAGQASAATPAASPDKKTPEPAKTASNQKSAPAASTAKGKGKSEASSGRRRMFISVLPGEQVEVALTEDGQLLEYYLDMLHQRKIKGNIYKGVIHNIDTNLQAAFVSYGAGKNGFLQIDEIHPEYWLTHHEPAKGKKFPPIQKVLKAGQEVLVQVVKEPTGSKGAFLTTWLSLAGRFLVLTPGQEQIGVSRKVDDDEERSRLREMMNGIDPGPGLGVIVRTVSAGTTKTTLKTDLQYLKRVWRDIRKKATEVTAPALIYQEPGLSERAVRDYLTEDVGEIWVDNEDVAQSIRETVNLLFPRKSDLVRLHNDVRTSMWERFNLRRQLDQIYTREVLLPSGGRLVFDQTEALMAIDINSGKISGKGNFEAMAHKTNMEAAEAIARHLKLRDIGGQVVIDFIEMRDKKHVIEVEKTLRNIMKNDRARHDVGRMSSFGLLELVRQRTGSSALAITMEPCPSCGGTGQRRNIEWQALQALREMHRMLRAENKEKCVYNASPELALYLLNHKRDSLREMEQSYSKCLEISVRP